MRRKLLALAASMLFTSFPVHAQNSRTIEADVNQVKGQTSRIWRDSVGAGRIGEGLRAGWREQLEQAKKDLGFNYLRAHGVLDDGLGVYSEDKAGNPRYNWQYIDDVYDYLISQNIRPFVEVGFMPKALAAGDRTIFWWDANVSTPKSYDKWDGLIKALVQHWTDRYGSEEVKKWRFEIWNEPQLSIFFQPPPGQSSRDAYFELYEHTAKDISSVNSDYVIGGPAGPGWFRELIDLSVRKDLPLDFISYHPYGLSGGPTGLDETGENLLYLSSDMNAVANGANSGLPIVKNSPKPNLPIYITEWSSSYSSRDPIHDTYFEAPYILRQIRNTEQMGAMSYWTFTDVFEENGPGWRPFHGGFGLINYQGIKKPAYWAYRYLSMLGPIEVKSSDPDSYVTKDDKGGYQILFWDLTHPIPMEDQGKVSDQAFFTQPLVADGKAAINIKLTNIRHGRYEVKTYRIGYHHNDPYSRYLEMGRPSDLSREEVAELKKLSSGEPESTIDTDIKGAFERCLPIGRNSVYLITLTPK